MEFQKIISDLIIDTKGSAESALTITQDSSLWAFAPELTICTAIVLMLLIRVFDLGAALDRVLGRWVGFGSAFVLALVGSGVALWFAAPWTYLSAAAGISADDPAAVTRMEIFTGMLVHDTFSVYMRSLLLIFSALFIVFTWLSGIPDREDGPDIYTLVLGATLGMMLMCSANHLLMVFLAVEMASVPSYVLAGMLKGRRESSEAALKYSIYGAGAAGVLLYGISLITGVTHSAHLPTIALQLADQLPTMPLQEQMVVSLGGLLIMCGLAFKLSAVPFHFWCPDVFEGASAEVGAFLSVASKAAALALLVRVAIGMGALPPDSDLPGERTARQSGTAESLAMFNVADEPAASESDAPTVTQASALERLAPVRGFTAKLIALFAIITCTFGNLAAFGQTNIKRLLAYSTIAHAGYMMMAVPALLALAGVDSSTAQAAAAALALYIAVYLFMNLGAFAVVAFLRNEMRSETIADYGGLIRRCPITVVLFALMLFSLVGLPPLAGFIGKFAIFASLASAFRSTSESYLMLLLVVGSINTAISLFYYLRVVKVMTMDPEPDSRIPFSMPFLPVFFLFLISLPTIGLIVDWNWLNEMALEASRHLLS